MRPFLELLPWRIDQALTTHTGRARRVRRNRILPPSPALTGPSIEKPRRLFIDLAVISRSDAGTGIQRVVRAVALALMEEAPPDWEIHFVSATRQRSYHVITWPDSVSDPLTASQPLKARAGDLFLGLDFSLDAIRRHRRQLARFRSDGGKLWFLICDLLPLDRPEWFSPNNVVRYRIWLDILAGIADGFLCISRQTEIDLMRALRERHGLVEGYHTAILPMGHDIAASMPGNDAGDGTNEAGIPTPRFDMSAPYALMVGTLEPRKGHADILDAFDILWRQGSTECLVLVGRLGWKVEALRARIRTHPEHGRKLLWFDDIDDRELERIYASCQGVIIGSLAEGFGLPLVEALGHGKAVIARDLPVFHPHEALGVRYFPADADAGVLADAIRQWLDAVHAGQIEISLPDANWRKSAQVLLSAISITSS